MTISDRLDRVNSKSVIFIDEAYLEHHSRMTGFGANTRQLISGLGLARQREHWLLFFAHEATQLDRYITSYANFFVIKEPSVMHSRFERAEIRALLRGAEDFFGSLEQRCGKKWAYISSPERDFEGPLQTPLPSYWSEDLSRAYAGTTSATGERPACVSKEEKKKQVKILRGPALSYRKIAERPNVRSKTTIINWLKSDSPRKG